MDALEFLADALRPYWGLWLMVLFLGIVVWAYWPGHRERFQSMASLPLRDDPEQE